VAHVPLWDMDAAVREVDWAAAAGLRGINFWSPRRGVRPYDKPEWEPLWSACEANRMLLATHAGFIDPDDASLQDPTKVPWLAEIEIGGWPCRKALHRMIFSGVFERHPDLNIMMTEQAGNWWSATGQEYDSAFRSNWKTMKRLGLPVDKKPSEYIASNVYIGASCMAPFEARRAVDEGYDRNICTGRDWPHLEGSWGGQPYAPDQSVRNWHLQLRYAMADLTSEQVEMMASGNAIRACHLDADVLAKITEATNALTYAQIAEPLPPEAEPEICYDQPLEYQGNIVAGVHAFRKYGTWG
jgi:predicted TIM-barrel fold metal-dependent hydrolase